MADGSIRAKLPHEPVAATCSSKFEVHRIVIKDSVLAGKTGKSQAQYVFGAFSEKARRKLGGILYDTTSSNTGEYHGLGAELNRLTDLDLMETECLLHVQSLPMVDFGTAFLGEAPSLHWGVNTPPHAIAYMLFQRYVEMREWPDLKEAYYVLFGQRYSARSQCVFSRWKYVFWSSIQARHRYCVTKSMAVLKTTWLTDPNATGAEIPPVQPIATLGCTASCTSTKCVGHHITSKECPLPEEATKVKRERHMDPVAQPLTYCTGALDTTEVTDGFSVCDAADLDEAAEVPVNWDAPSADTCEEFFLTMFTNDNEGGDECVDDIPDVAPPAPNPAATNINETDAVVDAAVGPAVALAATNMNEADAVVDAAAATISDANDAPTRSDADADADGVVDADANDAPTRSAWEAGTTFQIDNMVRVWWPKEDPPSWFSGQIDKVTPATVQVFYEESDTYSMHRLRTTSIEHMPTSSEVGNAVAAINTATAAINTATCANVSSEVDDAAAAINNATSNGVLSENPNKSKKGPRVKLVPPKTLDECGYHDRRWRPKVAGTLWQMLLQWTSGACGLYLYIQISVMALASDVFFHSMNWSMGSDSTPRLLKEDGGFVALPDGRRALELPDHTLAYLRELLIARHSWETTFKAEIELARGLPDDLEKDILESIPTAYDAAIKKYRSHLASYQLLPNSLSRMSEPTGPAYLRAFIVTFFPELATTEGFDQIQASDEDIVQFDADEVIEILSQAVAEGDERRQQFAHERLFTLSIYKTGKRVETEFIEAATALLILEHIADKDAARLRDQPVPKKRKSVKEPVRTEAAALKAQAIRDKQCNTLGLREDCAMVDGIPNETLSQLLRIAKTSTTELASPDPILWGVKCECAGETHHCPNCWRNVETVYWFLQQKFMHQYVHQMWLEGAFNVMDHNHVNTGSDLCESKLLNKMNDTSKINVASEEVRKIAADIKRNKTEANKDIDSRRLKSLNIYTSTPTIQRKKKAIATTI